MCFGYQWKTYGKSVLVHKTYCVKCSTECIHLKLIDFSVPQLTDGNYHSVLLEVTLGGRFDIWIDTKYIYNFTESDLVSPDANGIVGIDFGML